MKRWPIIVLLLLAGISTTDAQEFRPVRNWTFSLPHGSLRIDLKSSPDGSSSLGLSPNGQIPEAPVSEQIEPLKDVLREMPKLGLDPHKITYIGTRIFTHDVLYGLAYSCAGSQAWKSSMEHGGNGKEKVVVSLLNQSNAYGAYSLVFKQYGLQLIVSAVENVGLMRFSSVPPRNDHDRSIGRMLVPADAIIGIKLLPISQATT